MYRNKKRCRGSVLVNVIIILALILNILNILSKESSSRLQKIQLEKEVIKKRI